MRNSKTLYTGNAFRKLDCFDDFEILKVSGQNQEDEALTDTLVVNTSVAGDNSTIVDLGQIGKYLKMINPKANKTVFVKDLRFTLSGTVKGNNDATEEVPEVFFSLFAYRENNPPTSGNYDDLKRAVQNNSLIPLLVNAQLVPHIVYETLSGQAARHQGVNLDFHIPGVNQYAVQPLGFALILYDHLVEGNASVTLEYAAGLIIRYNVETVPEKMFRRMVEAYTSISPDIERRPKLPIGQA